MYNDDLMNDQSQDMDMGYDFSEMCDESTNRNMQIEESPITKSDVADFDDTGAPCMFSPQVK